MFTDTFPDDLTIYIFSFLSFSDIAVLHVLSHRFHQFLEDHADVLYHQLAVSHRYAKKGRLLEEVKNEESRRGGRHLRNVRGWKEFCRESCILNANWTSHGLAIVGGYTNLIDDPNEDALVDFAVDDEHGILLTLISRNSDHSKVLVVRTMDGQRVIWSLPEVTRFVHSGDYFLLWRGRTFMGEVEVWRYVTPPSSPSTTTNSTVTGTFALYATLPTPPGGWRNYAFRAPLLALVNPHQGHLVHLFELPPTPSHLEHPSEPPPKPVQLQAVRLIDLDTLLTTHSSIPDPAERHMLVFSVLLDLQISDKYLCACFDTGLVIARLGTDIHEEEDGESTGKGKATADAQRGLVRKDAIMLEATGQPDDDRRRMPTAQHVFREKRPSTPLTSSSSLPAVGIKYRVRTGWGVMGERMVKERTKEEIEKEESENSNALVRSSYRWNPNFISAQFSPNGKHLVAGTTFRCIYLFTDLDRIFDSAGVSPRDIVQKMAMEEPVRYLKWDTHDTVFAIRDDENETWLFDLCPTYHAHPNSHSPDENFDDPPLRLVGARALKVSVFGQPRPFVHGLQVRKTGVWAMSDLDLVLNRRADVDSGASVSHRTVCFVGFTDDLKGIL